jgi:hypothetical protein
MKKSEIQIIYPKSQLSNGVDEDYQAEVDAMLKYSKNINIVLFDDIDFKLINHKDGIAIFRGWMFNEADYIKFFNLCKDSGVSLITAPENYMKFHHLPNWYNDIKDFTPETVILDDLSNLDDTIKSLNWDNYFIKDYVKSLNTDCGAIANSIEEIKSKITKMELYRGEIEGGLCIRKVENFDVETEVRFFVVNGTILNLDIPIPDVVFECSEILKEKSHFFTIDAVKTKSGDYRIVEVGDGQVSGLKNLDLDVFCEEFIDNYNYIVSKYIYLKRANVSWHAIKHEHHNCLMEIRNGNAPLRRVELGLCVQINDLNNIKEMIKHYIPAKIITGSSTLFNDHSVFKCTHFNPYWEGSVFLTLFIYPSTSQKQAK